MKFKMTMVAAVVALSATNLYAQETYSVEAVGLSSNTNRDDQSKMSGTTLGAAYYIKPVKLENSKPFSELDFLQKASNVTLVYGNFGRETATFSNTTITPIGVSATLYADKLILGFDTTNWNSDFKFKTNSARYYGIKSATTGINVGYFVTPETAITFTNSKATGSYTPSTGLAAIGDSSVTTNKISSKTVTELGGEQSMRIDLNYTMITNKQSDVAEKKNTEYGIDLRYYPQSKFYIGGGYTANTGDYDYDKGRTLSVSAAYAFTPRFGFVLTTSKFTGDVSTEQSSATSTSIGLGYRF
jgi:hypothetical protein